MRAAKRVVAVSGMLIALIGAAVALGSTPQPGLTFSGGTSQPEGSVSFQVSRDGTKVTNFQAIMSARCTKAGKPEESIEVGLTPTPKIAIQDGAFGYTGGFELHNGPELIGAGKGAISGGFTSSTIATGTLSFPWTYNSNAGNLKGYACKTGRVTFQASSPQSSSPAPVPGPGGSSPSSSCLVPKLKGKRLRAAKRVISQGNCRPGRIVRRYSDRVRRGRVIAQKPAPGTQRGAGAKVKLVVSSGPAQ